MATIWRSHQVCKRCGWAGVTNAHRLNIVAFLAYLFAVLALFALDGLGALSARKVAAGSAGTVGIVWFYGLPVLIWRWNTCGGCRQRMVVELLSGHAPRMAQTPGPENDPHSHG